MDNILFRKLDEKDRELFIQLRMEYILETFKNVNKIKYLENNLKLYFNEHINKKDFIGIIGEFNGRVVSVAYLIITDFPPNPGIKEGKCGTLLNVFTFPEYRKKGIAKKLIEKIINEAKFMGIESIELKSTEDGYNLYKNLGFVENNEYKNMNLRLK